MHRDAADDDSPQGWIRDTLEKRKLTVSQLAAAIGCRPHRIHELRNGRRRITPFWAHSLGRALGLDPKLVLDVQSDYDLTQEFEQNVKAFNKVRVA